MNRIISSHVLLPLRYILRRFNKWFLGFNMIMAIWFLRLYISSGNDVPLFTTHEPGKTFLQREISTSLVFDNRTGVLENLTKQISTGTQSHTPDVNAMDEKLAHVRNICDTHPRIWKSIRPTSQTWTYKPLNLHFCSTPKVGCTYWKQVMRFVSGDYPKNKNITKPSDIDRFFVHYGALSAIKQSSVRNETTRLLMSGGISFMFSRNPYTRLWSAYIDKIFLPDFWGTQARSVMRLVRPNASANEKDCPKDLTFNDFLRFIVKTYPANLNEHWQPIYKGCDPCLVNYTFIGKLESFRSDTNIIFNKLGLNHLIENTTKTSRDLEEVRMITIYNFNIGQNDESGCHEKEDIAKRLWKTFQYNGYIHRDLDIPLSDMRKDNFTTNPKEVFLYYVISTMEYQEDNQFDLSNQKHSMMIEAFEKIPLEVLHNIQSVYEYDFMLFGYDKNIPMVQ